MTTEPCNNSTLLVCLQLKNSIASRALTIAAFVFRGQTTRMPLLVAELSKLFSIVPESSLWSSDVHPVNDLSFHIDSLNCEVLLTFIQRDDHETLAVESKQRVL